MKELILLALLPAGPTVVQDQSFMCRPNNPAFGGTNNYNYGTILSMAQLQDKTKLLTAPAKTTLINQSTDLDNFTRSLQNTLLNWIRTQLTNQTIRGQVLCNTTKKPVSKALVRLSPSGRTLETDSGGWFRFDSLSVGKYSV